MSQKKFIIFTAILSVIAVCLLGVLIYQNREEKIEELPELSYNDFEDKLGYDYKMLNCNIQTNSIEFYVSGMQDFYYTTFCKNLKNMMTEYAQNRENANQKEFTIFVYKNNVLDYKDEETEAVIKYNLSDSFCEVNTSANIPAVDDSDGLVPYEFVSFDGEMLEVILDMPENTSLLEQVKQVKVLYKVAEDLNYIDNFKIKFTSDKTYVYNGSNIIQIIEKRTIQ